MKLFKNGSIQMSGCKKISAINIAINKLIINKKYPEFKMEKYKIENNINIDEKLISQVEQILEYDKPTYPKHITVYEEKGSMYIQYNKKIKDTRYNKKNKISSNDIQKELDRRKPGQSRLTTPRDEEDIAEIFSGVSDGLTLGMIYCDI